MDQVSTEGRRRRRAQSTVYDGNGEQIAPQARPASAPRRSNVTKAKQPIGRSEELREKQQAYQEAYRFQQSYQRPQQEPRQPRRRADAVYDDFDVYDRDSRKVYSSADIRKKRKDPHRGLWAVIIFLCVMCIAALGLFVAPQLLGIQYSSMPNCAFVNGSIITLDQDTYSNYKLYRRYMNTDTIYPGVYVDGVSVGEMTLDEAREAIAQATPSGSGEFFITVNVGNMSWSIDSGKVPLTRNVDEILAQAYALGRSNTTAIRGTRITPFQERLNAAMDLRANPVNLGTSITYDKASIRELTDAIVQYVNRDPVDASVATFDFNTRGFTFNSESVGAYIDGDALYNQVISKLDSGERTATITVEPEVILASVTKTQLMNSFKLVSSYTTTTTSNSNRNTNIELSANAINGSVVMPGETFSFNEATGQRTAAKGYKEATAISGGQSVPEVGGGVCQTSSTLFNAAMRANMEIVERSPHAWPSTYVDKGLDATVNWPNLDFKFKNSSDWPIFIVAYYANKKVTVEIYGMSLGDGVTIDLESEVTKTVKPPSETKYVQNTSLPSGTQKTTIQARTGYEVNTYRVWYLNGEETSRELLCTSTYRMYQETVEYN